MRRAARMRRAVGKNGMATLQGSVEKKRRSQVMRIAVLRHGVTQANIKRRYISRSDVPLSEDAYAALAPARRRLAAERPLSFTSDMSRCLATLARVCPHSSRGLEQFRRYRNRCRFRFRNRYMYRCRFRFRNRYMHRCRYSYMYSGNKGQARIESKHVRESRYERHARYKRNRLSRLARFSISRNSRPFRSWNTSNTAYITGVDYGSHAGVSDAWQGNAAVRAAVRDARLRELDFGGWEGRTYEDLRSDPHYCAWLDDMTAVIPPGGESWLQFAARTEQAWRAMLRQASMHRPRRAAHRGAKPIAVLVVTHGGVLRRLHGLAWPAASFWDIPAPTGGGYVLVVQRQGKHWRFLRTEPLIH